MWDPLRNKTFQKTMDRILVGESLTLLLIGTAVLAGAIWRDPGTPAVLLGITIAGYSIGWVAEKVYLRLKKPSS